MDMECDEAVWTFYINPKKRDTIKPTVDASAIKKEAKQTGEQATEQENSNDTKSNGSAQTKNVDSSVSQTAKQTMEQVTEKENVNVTKSTEPAQTRKMHSSKSEQNEKESKSW